MRNKTTAPLICSTANCTAPAAAASDERTKQPPRASCKAMASSGAPSRLWNGSMRRSAEGKCASIRNVQRSLCALAPRARVPPKTRARRAPCAERSARLAARASLEGAASKRAPLSRTDARCGKFLSREGATAALASASPPRSAFAAAGAHRKSACPTRVNCSGGTRACSAAACSSSAKRAAVRDAPRSTISCCRAPCARSALAPRRVASGVAPAASQGAV